MDSALKQTYQNIEVVVVDDGSKDESCNIISAYQNRIISILKQNGGQASALNVGIEVSKGDIIFFLDADDMFLPDKVEKMMQFFAETTQENSNVFISNYIGTVDTNGLPIDVSILDTLSTICCWNYLDEIRGKRKKLIDGNITRLSTSEQAYRFVAKYRFLPYLGMSTSGFAMTRSLAEKIFPLPCDAIKISADDFIVKAASVLGTVYLTNYVLTKYRIHGKNNWYSSQEKPKKVFSDSLDKFLNTKLELIGKKAAFSYSNSMHAKSHYITHYGYACSNQLFELAVKVIQWHINITTIVFFVKTTALAIIFKLKDMFPGLNFTY